MYYSVIAIKMLCYTMKPNETIAKHFYYAYTLTMFAFFNYFLHTLCIGNSLSNSIIIFQFLKCYDTDQCYVILPVYFLKIKIVIITFKMLRFITPLDLLANACILH